MESTSEFQAVVRQGTFDTDLSQTRATEGSYEIPIIDSEERKKSAKEKGSYDDNSKRSSNGPEQNHKKADAKNVVKTTKDPDTRSLGGKQDTGPSFVLSTPSSNKKDKKETDKKLPVASKPPRPQAKNNNSDSKMDGPRTGAKEGEAYEAMYQERNTLLKAELAYKRRIKQLEEDANGFLQSIEDLNSENKLLRSKVDLLETQLQGKGDLSSIDRAVKSEKARLEMEERVKVLEKQLNEKNSEVEGEGSTENLHKQIRELKAQVIKLQTDNQDINEENIKLKAEHLEQVKKLHALEKEKLSLASSVTDVESEKLDKIKNLQHEYLQLKKEVTELKARNTELEKKVDALEFENKALSDSLSQKKTELNEILGVMKEENKFDNEIKDQKNQIKKLKDEKRELEMTFNKEKRVLNEELEDYKSKYEKSCKDLEEIKEKLDSVETENSKYKEDNKTLSDTVEEQKIEIERLKGLISQLEAQADTEKEKYNSLKADTENANSDLIRKKEELEKTNVELQGIIGDKESQISKLISQMDSLRSEREEEKTNWKEEKDKLNAEIKRLAVFEASSAQLDKELKRTKASLEDTVNSKRKLAVLLSEKENSFSFLEQQMFELNMKLDNMTKRFNQMDREKRDIEKEKRDWEVKRDKFNDIEASNKRLIEENRRLRGSLEDRSLLEPKSDYRNSPEAWTGETGIVSPSQRAVYVVKDDKKRNQQNYNRIHNRRGPLSKSSPTAKSKPPVPKRDSKPPVSPSRSYEDIRKVDKSPDDSSTSLPDIQQHESRLTYGLGYRDIHRNRIKAANKHVY